MDLVLVDRLPVAETLLFYALVGLFWWPSWRWLGATPWGRQLAPTERAAIALASSFGVFAALSGPLLLLHLSTASALRILLPAWILYLTGAEYFRRGRGPHRPDSPNSTTQKEETIAFHLPQRPLSVLLLGLSAFAVAGGRAAGWLPHRLSLGLLGLVVSAAGGAALLSWLRSRSAAPIPLFPTSAPHTEATIGDRILKAVLLALVLTSLLSTAFRARTDTDDNLYLSEALLLQDSPAMGLEAPTHRGEALPSNPVYAWQSFELWAAIMAKGSGTHPLFVLRSLIGPLLFLASLALYGSLLRWILPPSLRTGAMVLLCAYFLFGMSSHWTPNNYLLTRPQQGKTWLMHLGVAALILQAIPLLRAPSASRCFTLLLLSFACLGWAPTAVLLVPTLLGFLALAQMMVAPSFKTMRGAGMLALCILPQLLFGFFLFLQEGAISKEDSLAWTAGSHWMDLLYFQFFQGDVGGGGLELATLAASPLLLLLLPKLTRRAFPMWFSIGLVAILLNPLLFPWLSGDIMGEVGYLRLLWLLPIPLLLAALGACLAGVAARGKLSGPGYTTGILAALLAFPLCGAHAVWSRANLYFPVELGVDQISVENPYKMPQGLLNVARELQTLPLGPEHRILCSLSEVNHLAPLVPAFDFVFARDYQTVTPLHVLGRMEEAARRMALGTEFLEGKLQDEVAAPSLLAEKAEYVLIGPFLPPLSEQLKRLGYGLRFTSGGFSLWVRKSQ